MTDSETHKVATAGARTRGTIDGRIRSLLVAVEDLLDQQTAGSLPAISAVPSGSQSREGWALSRLAESVVRPLKPVVGRRGSSAKRDRAAPTDCLTPDRLAALVFDLALQAIDIRLELDAPLEIQEASAALQHVAVELAPRAPPRSAPERAAEFWSRQRDLSPGIVGLTNGPFLITNVATISNWLGEPVRALPQMALCRCGASAIKPRCDGSHARIGFTSGKDASRVPDRRDTYAGLQATVYDNRGLCQHSGFCTNRLPSVFHADAEPFVTPSGGPLDEIIRAARDCPSGAVSYGLDGREARQEVDHHHAREPAIEVSKDGPYRVTGGIPLADGSQADESRNEGASREHYALCRCGHSQNKPFCSGKHWDIGFRDPPGDPTREPTIFEWCGGLPALLRMTRVFYERYVPRDPLLAPLFGSMSPDHPERVAKWFGEVFGGPKRYSQDYGGYPRMLSQHVGKSLSEEQRQRWVSLILQSAQDAGLPNDAEFRSAFGAYVEWGSRLAVENSQPGAHPPEQMPMPNWHWNTAAGPPGSRMSASARERGNEAPRLPPGPDEPVSFERHIRPLFRSQDRRSMKFAFDLWDYGDVSNHAVAIYDRLESGTMPCDGAWDEERLDVFKRWIDTGKAA